MPSAKKSQTASSKGVINSEEGIVQNLEGGEEVQDERIVARRADLLRTRQVDLDTLMARHDDLVREAFHLDKFVTLLDYDPKIARQDNSQVFIEYKALHDLISKSVAAVASGSTPRKTRRVTTELRVSLSATISSSISVPPSTPSSLPVMAKEKPTAAPWTQAITTPTPKMVGKMKPSAKSTAVIDSSISKGKGKGKESTTSHSSKLISKAILPPPLLTQKRLPHPRKAKEGVASSNLDNSNPNGLSTSGHSRSLKRKRSSPPSLLSDLEDSRPFPIANMNGEHLVTEPEPPSQAKLTIKRIRLFQRPPPAVYSHPSQVPPRPRYGSSIQQFLQSYSSLEDGADDAHERLEEMAFAEANTRARIQELKKEGRLLLDIPDLTDDPDGLSSFAAPEAGQVEPIRREDLYDHLVSAATQRARSVSFEYASKKNTAKKVAKLIMAWHGNKEGTEEKQRKAEAIRMKSLAKFTAKEVEKQWKRAVMAVRDQNRALLEAEEVRLGRKHLDAILDQSGVILEAQHTDLSRARSRSSSAKGWSDSNESEADDSDTMEQGEDSDLGTGSEATEDDANVSFLLGMDAQGSAGSRGPSSEVEFESATQGNDADISSAPSPRDTPGPMSDGSLGTPINEDVGQCLSTSEISTEEHPRLGDKTNPSGARAFDDPMDLDDEHGILLREHILEPPESTMPLVAGSLQSPISVPEVVHSASPPSVSSANEYRETRFKPSPRSISSTQPSPPLAPSDDLSCPHLYSPEAPSPSPTLPNLPDGSIPGPTPDRMSPLAIQEDNAVQPNGRHPIAIRLSNGVVIYRDAEASSAPEEVEPSSKPLPMPNGDMESIPVDVVESAEVATSGAVLPTKATLPEAAIESTAVHSRQSEDPIGRVTGPIADVPLDQAEPDATSTASPGADEVDEELQIAPHLNDFAATHVNWDPTYKVTAPFLLRGTLRPYQQSGLEWLASLHTNNLNGILADEMGLGKTIQTISLLAHLACDRGIWGPHLIVVPTSVLLNWEMEFKKFLPGFKILPYHGSTKRRKELRVGWNSKHTFNVCVTSYTLASRDAHIFKRKAWYYMVLDEAHMIKNFKSQRWNILLMFRSFRRLLLTGTPLQNNLTELWALLQFLMSGTNFANLKEFGDWFSNPLEKAIEQGTVMDEETQERVRKLHTVLRPYLLRRLKADVEKELPSKFEHLVVCRLSKRQRFLYDEFMSRAQTRDALASGVYHKVANILMQLRKVCNHPDLFEVRPIVTSFAMSKSAVADFEIKELLVRRRFLDSHRDTLNLDLLGLVFIQHQGRSMIQARSTRTLDASSCLPFVTEIPGEPPPADTRTIQGFKRHITYQRQLAELRRWTQVAYTNRLRCAASPIYGIETISVVRRLYMPLGPLSVVDFRRPNHLDISSIIPTFVKSYSQREEDMEDCTNRFAFITPQVVARDLPSIALSGMESRILYVQRLSPDFDSILHRTSVKLQIAFPDASLVQYDCGKLQELASLLRTRAAGGHRVLIFTQMTKVLDILEIFLNFHGYRYLRLDGATRIEDRQYITERFNTDARVFAFIASSRSGGVGINLTGADTVIFYDSDFNPQMDRQCEDRAHRIGQIRDVHIYRFISEHTVEESMLRKANQKRSLDNIVIQQGEFDWRSLLIDDEAFGKALGEFEDKEDAYAARVAAREEAVKEVEDQADFAAEADDGPSLEVEIPAATVAEEEKAEEEGTVADYMLAFVNREWDWFSTWRL